MRNPLAFKIKELYNGHEMIRIIGGGWRMKKTWSGRDLTLFRGPFGYLRYDWRFFVISLIITLPIYSTVFYFFILIIKSMLPLIESMHMLEMNEFGLYILYMFIFSYTGIIIGIGLPFCINSLLALYAYRLEHIKKHMDIIRKGHMYKYYLYLLAFCLELMLLFYGTIYISREIFLFLKIQDIFILLNKSPFLSIIVPFMNTSVSITILLLWLADILFLNFLRHRNKSLIP